MKLNNKFYRGGAAVLSALLATGCFMGNRSEAGAATQGFPYANATKEAGDVTLDGKVTLADARMVLRKALKIDMGIMSTWTQTEIADEKGEAWGPYTSSVLEVRVSSDYQGKSPASEDTLRVYYPYGLNELRDTEVLLKEGQEYVFVTNALDDDFVARREKENPDDKFYQERYADVYISGASYSVLPVVEDKV